MKNWLLYSVGQFEFIPDPSQQQPGNPMSALLAKVSGAEGTYQWRETGFVYIDPATITAVMHVENGKEPMHTRITIGYTGYCTLQKTAKEVIADIQIALS